MWLFANVCFAQLNMVVELELGGLETADKRRQLIEKEGI